MKKGCLLALASMVALSVFVALGLLFLASRSQPLPGIAETLASLPEAERAALRAACGLAGIDPHALRVIGGGSEYLFTDERNRASLYVREGRVRALCLRGARFSAVPDFKALSALEALWLQDGELPGWPDLGSLSALAELRLDGQPLGDPVSGLPAGLEVLGLSRTRVTALAPLAALSKLRSLDLADTAVTDFSPLLPLQLETLDVARTKVAAVPAQVPRSGAWQVDLTGAPVLSPPGFSWEGPGGWSFTGTALGRETRSGGPVRASGFEINGTGSEVPALRPVALPTDHRGSRSVGPVVVEASIETGRARIWMDEPPGLFASAWFTQGHVKGFGFVRRSGHVFADLDPGQTVKLRGSLMLTGPIEHDDFHFLVQPLDGTRPTGLRYRVTPGP
jgi:hypothetical protein